MKIEEIVQKRIELDSAINRALTTMERKDYIRTLREQLIDLQNKCPHVGSLCWPIVDGVCPYCGKHIIIDLNT